MTENVLFTAKENVALLIILGLCFLSIALQIFEEVFPQKWHRRAFCTQCGWSDKPHGGNIWFTEQHYPVCPLCGNDCYEMRTARFKFVKLELMKGD